jgi:hypothetical protein
MKLRKSRGEKMVKDLANYSKARQIRSEDNLRVADIREFSRDGSKSNADYGHFYVYIYFRAR